MHENNDKEVIRMQDTKTILVVDDDAKIRETLRNLLQLEGFQVMEALDGRNALDTFYQMDRVIDLILLDVMLPGYDGWTVCREIRKQSDVPIIMFTARCEDFDEVHSFEVGADDFVKKSKKPIVLTARINALFRRIDKTKQRSKKMEFHNLLIDDNLHTVMVNGQEIHLSPKEYNILLILAENKGKIVSRERLMNLVWGYEYYGGLRTVDTHMNRLRIKLGEKGESICTIRGFGYRF